MTATGHLHAYYNIIGIAQKSMLSSFTAVCQPTSRRRRACLPFLTPLASLRTAATCFSNISTYGFSDVLSYSVVSVPPQNLLADYIPSIRRSSFGSAGFWFNSFSRSPTVGTVSGSKSSTRDGLMGTQTRPVLGWIQNGAFSKWFRCLETSASIRG